MVGKAQWLPDQVKFILRLKERNPRISHDEIAAECTRTGRWPRKAFNSAGIRYVLTSYQLRQGDSTAGASDTSVVKRISGKTPPAATLPQQQVMQRKAFVNALTPQEVARQQHAEGQTSTLNSAGGQIFATMQTPQPMQVLNSQITSILRPVAYAQQPQPLTSSEQMSINSGNDLQFSHNRPSTELQTFMQNNAWTSPFGMNKSMDLPYHHSGCQGTESSQSSNSGGSAKRGYTSDDDDSVTLRAKSAAQFKPTKIARSNSKYTGFATKNKEQKARPRAESTSKLSRPAYHMSPQGLSRVRSESVSSMPPPPVPQRLSQGPASSSPQMYQAQGVGYRPSMGSNTNFGNFSGPTEVPQLYGPGMSPNMNTQSNTGNLPHPNASPLMMTQGRPQMNPQMTMNNSFNAYGSAQTGSHPNMTSQGNSENFSNPNNLQQMGGSAQDSFTGSELRNATQQQAQMSALNTWNPQPSTQLNLDFLRRFGPQTLQGSQPQHNQVSQPQQQQAQWTPVPQQYIPQSQPKTSAAGQGQGSSPALQSSSAAAPLNFFPRHPSWTPIAPDAPQGAFGKGTRQGTTLRTPGNNAGGQVDISGNFVGQYQPTPMRPGASSYAQYSQQDNSGEPPSLFSSDVGGPQITHPNFVGQLTCVAEEQTDLRGVSPQSEVYSNAVNAQESVSTTVKNVSSIRQDSNNAFVGHFQQHRPSPQNLANSPRDASDAIKISSNENDSPKVVGQLNDMNIKGQQSNQAQIHLIPKNTYPLQDTSSSSSRLPLQVEQAALARPLSALNTQVPSTDSTRATATSTSISHNPPSTTHINYLQQVNGAQPQTASSASSTVTMNAAGRRDLHPVNYAELTDSSSSSSSDPVPSPSVQQAARRSQAPRSHSRLSARGSSRPSRGASTPRRRQAPRRTSSRVNKHKDVGNDDEEEAENAESSQNARGSSQIAMDEAVSIPASQATYSDNNEASDEILPNINQGRVPQLNFWSPYDAQAPVPNFGQGQSFSSVFNSNQNQASSSARPETPTQASSGAGPSYHAPEQAYSFPGYSEQVDNLIADGINLDAAMDTSAIDHLMSQEEFDRIADELFADPNFGALEPENVNLGPGEPVTYNPNFDPNTSIAFEYEGIFDNVDVSKIHQYDLFNGDFGDLFDKKTYPAGVDRAEQGDFGFDGPEFPDLNLSPYQRISTPSYNNHESGSSMNSNQAGTGPVAIFSNESSQQGTSFQSNTQVFQAPVPNIAHGIQFDAGGDLYGAEDDDVPAIRIDTTSNSAAAQDNTANAQAADQENANNFMAEADAAEGTAAAASTADDTAPPGFVSIWFDPDEDIWERDAKGEIIIANTTSATEKVTPDHSRAEDSLVRPTAYTIHAAFAPDGLDNIRNAIPKLGSISSRRISLDDYDAKMREYHIIQLNNLMPDGMGGFGTHENIVALPKNAFKRALRYLPKGLEEREEWHDNILKSSKVATSSNSKDNEAMSESDGWFEKLYYTTPTLAVATAEAKKEEEERVAFQKKLVALPLEYRNSDRAYFLASTQNDGTDMFSVNPLLKHRMPPALPVSEDVRKREIEEERRARVAKFCKANGKRVTPGDVVEVEYRIGLPPTLKKVGIAERRRAKELANAAAGKISINIPDMQNKIDLVALDPRNIAASAASISSKAKGKQKEGVSGLASQQQPAMSYKSAISGVLTPMDIEEQISLSAAQGITLEKLIANSVDLSPTPAHQSTDELMADLFGDESTSARVGSPDLLSDITARHAPATEDGSWDDSILDFFLKPYDEL